MADYKEIVCGRIVTESGEPIVGATVKVYDKDMLVDDHLGTAESAADGRFRIDFRWSVFKDKFGLPEGRPDIFLRVKTPSGQTIRTDVWTDLSGALADDDSEEVMDLGDVTVEA